MQSVDLLELLRPAFPTVSAYRTVSSVIQANAEGHKLALQYQQCPYPNGGDSEGNGQGVCPTDDIHVEEEEEEEEDVVIVAKEVFIKLVEASNYAHKSWTDCRRTLLYMRTEVRFYNEILPLLQSSSSSGFKTATPHIFMATCQLEGLVDEDETPMEPSRRTQADIDDNALLKPSSSSSLLLLGGYILMESIGDEHYYQDSPISKSQAKDCLAAVAQLHAAAWEDSKLLQHANDRLSRGSYHLDTRNPQELMDMTDAWEHFSNQFRHDFDPELLARTTDLGQRIKDLARYISDEISPGPRDPYATLAHGDFKAMNCFLPNRQGQDTAAAASATDLPVLVVDFASTGVGLGMSDVAMHIHHAVRAEDLANGGEEELVDYYLEELNRLLAARPSNNNNDNNNSRNNNNNNNNALYPRTVALRHYRLAFCDYFRFVLGRFWKSASPASFDKQQNSRNTLLANRNVASALAFLDRADRYLRDIEKERQETLLQASRRETNKE